jgi:hypothetical protein
MAENLVFGVKGHYRLFGSTFAKTANDDGSEQRHPKESQDY